MIVEQVTHHSHAVIERSREDDWSDISYIQEPIGLETFREVIRKTCGNF
jgi:hypothetical protein